MNDATLSRQARQGLIWGIGGKAGQLLANLLVLMALSRLLGPAEFGIYAIAWLVIDLAYAVAHSGFGVALVRESEWERPRADAYFTAFVLTGLALGGLTALAALPVERALAMPGLAPVLWAVAAVVPVKLIAAYHMFVLQRAARLKANQALQTLPTALTGLLVTVPAALMGAGVWSLVAGFAGASLIELIGSVRLSRERPRLTRALAPLRPMLHTGSATLANRMVVFAGESLDKLAVAALLGGAALGLYNRATSLVFLPTKLLGMPVENVFLTLCARLQDQRARIAALLARTLELQAVVLVPASLGLALATPLLVELVLGRQWLAAIPAAQVLFLVTFARLGYIPTEMAALATGKAWGAAGRQLVFTVAMLGAVAGASYGGLVWAAAGVALARVLFYLLSLRFVVREFGLAPLALAAGHLRGLAVAALALVPAFAVMRVAAEQAGLAGQAIVPAVYGLGCAGLLALGPRLLIGGALAELRGVVLARLPLRADVSPRPGA